MGIREEMNKRYDRAIARFKKQNKNSYIDPSIRVWIRLECLIDYLEREEKRRVRCRRAKHS